MFRFISTKKRAIPPTPPAAPLEGSIESVCVVRCVLCVVGGVDRLIVWSFDVDDLGGTGRESTQPQFKLVLTPSLPDCAQRLPQDLGRCARPTKPHATMGVSASHRALAARRSPWDEPIERVKRPPEAVRQLNTLPSFPLPSLPGQSFFLFLLLTKNMFRRWKLSI